MRVAPEDSAEMVEEILATASHEAAKAVGEGVDTLTNTHLFPKRPDVPRYSAPDVGPNLEVRLTAGDRSQILSPRAQRKSLTRLAKETRRLERAIPRVNFNKSTVRMTGKGYEMDGLIGVDGSRGFRSMQDMLDYSKTIDGNQFTDMQQMVVDMRTNRLSPVADVPVDHRGEYFLQVLQKDEFLVDDVGKAAIGMKRADPEAQGLKKMFGKKDGLVGQWAKWFNKTASLHERWRIGGATAADQYANTVKALNELLTPLSKLRPKRQIDVQKTIEEGDRVGKWFTRADLEERWGHLPSYPSMVKAYESFLTFANETRRLLNDSTYNRMMSEKIREATIDGETRLVTSVDRVPPDLQWIFDPKSNKIREIDPTEIRHLQNTPGSFLKFNIEKLSDDVIELEDGLKDITRRTRYSLAEGVDLIEPPKQVLRADAGNIMRIHGGNYVVRRVVPVVDDVGKNSFDTTIEYTGRTKAEAERFARELSEAADDGAQYDVALSSSLAPDVAGYAETTNLRYLEKNGELHFGERSKEVLDIYGDRMVTPVSERLAAMREAASRANVFDFTIDAMVENWEKAYPNYLNSKGKINLFEKIRPVNDTPMEALLAKEAEAARDHILVMMGADTSMLRKAVKESAIWAAGHLNTEAMSFMGQTRNRLAGGILETAKGGFINLPKQLAFLRWIVGQPLRQLVLQSQQMSVYFTNPGMLKYSATGQFFRDHAAILSAMAARDWDSWAEIAPSIGKLNGMSADELTEFVDALRISGLVDNIDSHAFTEVMTLNGDLAKGNNAVQRVTGSAANYAKRFAKVMRKGGFDAGETFQITAAFLAKRNEWILE